MALSEEQVRSKFLISATQGALVRNWCQHPGFKLYHDALQSELDDKKNVWIRGTEEEAKAARAEAKGILVALNILKKFMAAGIVAKQGLKKIQEDLGNPID